MLKEFRDFVARGNVMDLAVGVIMGAAFGRIVTSLVEGVIMPPLGLLLGRTDFSGLFFVLDSAKGVPMSLADAKAKGIPVIAYGQFINEIVSFLIVALAVFLLVKQVNRIEVGARPPGARRGGDDQGVPVLRVGDSVSRRRAVRTARRSSKAVGSRQVGSNEVAYISTCTPSSTTRSGGRWKNAVARTALRAMTTKNCSRHTAMPGRSVTMIVSRPRK